MQHLTYAVKVLGVLMLTLLLSSCGVNEVVVEGRFPSPLLDKLPVTLGVYYKPEFREHEFFDEATTRGESDWVVKTGAAQVQMYNTLLEGMFERVVLLNELPRKDRVAEVGKQAVDAILVPEVNELQYSIPTHTKINVFEIWMRYRYELYSANGEQLADWTMTAYGKTPTAFLRSAEAAVNLAAVVALRDAGANFAVNFEQVPEVKLWLENTADRRATP
ncbi:hypothetical protein EYC98_17410 [Halieaceae bacterium IMCC14734]|uniref:DUF4136 domain-containing protein n=1 Tax=Candidatus Litorirhabdus singularis TaxID=2518993 RepID=A0ABT3TK09_9GAMM|nr:hypothetical protein [Candidatus Litorirhabdus singularis]